MAFAYVNPWALTQGFNAEDKRIADRDAQEQKLQADKFALETQQQLAPMKIDYQAFKLQDAQEDLAQRRIDRQNAASGFAASGPARELYGVTAAENLRRQQDTIALDGKLAASNYNLTTRSQDYEKILNAPDLTPTQRQLFINREAPAFAALARTAVAGGADPATIMLYASRAGAQIVPPPANATPDQMNVWRIEAGRQIDAKQNSFAAQNYDVISTGAAKALPGATNAATKAAMSANEAGAPESGVPGVADLQKQQIALSKEIRGALKDGVPETDPLLSSLRAQYSTTERQIQAFSATPARPAGPPANPDYSQPMGTEGARTPMGPIRPTLPTPQTASAEPLNTYAAELPRASPSAIPSWATDIARLKAQLQALPPTSQFAAERLRLRQEIVKLYASEPTQKFAR